MSPMPKQRPHRSRQTYATPWPFVHAVEALLGIDRFTMDFAADARNAKAHSFWTQRDDSLSKNSREWVAMCQGGWGWLNPPFTDIGAWAKKCAMVGYHAKGAVAMLVPASVGSNWFRDYVHGNAYVLALNGRIAFDPKNPKWGYPKDCMLCLYGHAPRTGFDVWTWK